MLSQPTNQWYFIFFVCHRKYDWFTRFLSTDHSKAVPLLQFFFVCASVILSLFIYHLSLFWRLGKSVLHDCCITWISSLILFIGLHLWFSHLILIVSRGGNIDAMLSFFRNHENILYNFDPLKHHFYIVKLGLTGVYIRFLISARRGGSYEYPQSMFWAEIWKNIRIFCLITFLFWL